VTAVVSGLAPLTFWGCEKQNQSIREGTRRVAKNTFLSTKDHEEHLFIREGTRRIANNTFLSSKSH